MGGVAAGVYRGPQARAREDHPRGCSAIASGHEHHPPESVSGRFGGHSPTQHTWVMCFAARDAWLLIRITHCPF